MPRCDECKRSFRSEGALAMHMKKCARYGDDDESGVIELSSEQARRLRADSLLEDEIFFGTLTEGRSDETNEVEYEKYHSESPKRRKLLKIQPQSDEHEGCDYRIFKKFKKQVHERNDIPNPARASSVFFGYGFGGPVHRLRLLDSKYLTDAKVRRALLACTLLSLNSKMCMFISS